MADETYNIKISDDEAVLEKQFRRAVSSFEGIVLSQIDIKNKLADRLNYSIRAGIIILGVIAISILILLLTLSSQLNKISYVVNDMNVHFGTVSEQMAMVNEHITFIEKRVALLSNINQQTEIMDREMNTIAQDMAIMQSTVGGISRNVSTVRSNVGNISSAINHMGMEVLHMSRDMGRISKPSRSMNKMFPFP